MNALLEQIRGDALGLPLDERRQLIHALVDSLPTPEDAEVAPAWDDEIARRIKEVEAGQVKCLSHEEFMAMAEAACK